MKCLPANHPHLLTPTFYRMDDVKSGNKYELGSVIGFAGTAQKTIASDLTLFIALWDVTAMLYLHDEQIELVPLTTTNF